MNLFDLKNMLENNHINSCYYLCGNDNYILKQAEKAIVQALNIEYPELNVNNFFENVNVDNLVDTLDMVPFMSKYRLVVVKEFYPTAEAAKYFSTKFLKNPTDNCICLIINTKNSANIEKHLQGMQCIIDCNHPSLEDCTKWVIKKMQIAGISISRENAKLLCEYVLCDMSSISLHCEKIILYLTNATEVTIDDINQLVQKQTEYKIYEFTEAIAIKDRVNAYTIMGSFLEKKSDAISLLGALYGHYRRMLFSLISKKTSLELAEYFKIKNYAVQKILQQAKKFTPKLLKEAVVLIQNSDYYLKSGYMESGNVLDYVVLKLMNL